MCMVLENTKSIKIRLKLELACSYQVDEQRHIITEKEQYTILFYKQLRILPMSESAQFFRRI